jgi:hypothetical protein
VTWVLMAAFDPLSTFRAQLPARSFSCHNLWMKKSPPPFGHPLTTHQKRQFLKDRYYLMAGPLLLLLGVSLTSPEPSSFVLAWVSGILLVGLTVNRLMR